MISPVSFQLDQVNNRAHFISAYKLTGQVIGHAVRLNFKAKIQKLVGVVFMLKSGNTSRVDHGFELSVHFFYGYSSFQFSKLLCRIKRAFCAFDFMGINVKYKSDKHLALKIAKCNL